VARFHTGAILERFGADCSSVVSCIRHYPSGDNRGISGNAEGRAEGRVGVLIAVLRELVALPRKSASINQLTWYTAHATVNDGTLATPAPEILKPLTAVRSSALTVEFLRPVLISLRESDRRALSRQFRAKPTDTSPATSTSTYVPSDQRTFHTDAPIIRHGFRARKAVERFGSILARLISCFYGKSYPPVPIRAYMRLLCNALTLDTSPRDGL
jgi:hypothetical protein